MNLRRLREVFAVAVAIAWAGGLVIGQGQAQTGQAQGQAGRAGGAQQTGQQTGQAGQQGRGGQGGRGAQRDPNGQQEQPVGTGSISGQVVLEGAGTPVKRARMTLSGAELRGQRNATTDDQGNFQFTTLPAGRYTLSASKLGYVNMTYGAKAPGRRGTPIQLADGQKIDKAVIRMPKGSVVTGIVVDENGEATPGTQVRVFRFVMTTGVKTLENAGQAQTDDRGIYRIYGLQPGDYLVSATPRNGGANDLQQSINMAIESLTAQAQAAGANLGGRGGGGAGGGRGGAGGPGGGLGALVGGGRGQQIADQIAQLQQQRDQSQQGQAVAYAPVYYPGTTQAQGASTLALGVSDEHGGVDFQLQLVPTATVSGVVVSPTGQVPQNIQVVMQALNQGMPQIPGVGTNQSRVGPDGRFTFSNVVPGQYTIAARGIQFIQDPNQPANAQQNQGGRGGRGGPGGGPGGRGGMVGDVLWAAADITVSGQNVPNVSLTLQSGMTVSGRVEFRGTATQAPTDLTTVRVNLQPQGQQILDIGGGPMQGQVDANGNFTIKGVPPGQYVLRGNAMAGQRGAGGFGGAAGGAAATGGGGRGGGAAATTPGQAQGGSWTLRSSVVAGRDSLDFPIDIRPNDSPSGAVLTFVDKTQSLDGTLQDSTGRPTADYTIIVFAADKQYWLPQSRRISSTRPGTDGKFSFRGLPPGDYRLTAVTDAENGEWYDPAFLAQLASSSIAVSLKEGESKTQDIRVAGGG